jgi:hypothetical protein
MDPLLGNDLETNETTAIATQQLGKYAVVLEPLLSIYLQATIKLLFGSGVFCGFLCS